MFGGSLVRWRPSPALSELTGRFLPKVLAGGPPSLSSSWKRSHRERRVVPFTPERMFDVVADVDRYSEFVPFCTGSRVLGGGGLGGGGGGNGRRRQMDAEMSVGFNIFTERYTSRVTLVRPESITVRALDSPTFQTLTSRWLFSPGPKRGTCFVDFEVAFEVENPVMAGAVSTFFSEVAERQVNAFEGRCEVLSRRAAAEGKREQKRRHGDDSSSCDAVVAVEPIYDALRRHGDGGGVELRHFQRACEELSQLEGNFGALAKSPELMTAVIATLEQQGNGGDDMSLSDFALGVHMMVRGSPEERSRFLFRLFDTNQNDRLERDELERALRRHVETVGQVLQRVMELQLRDRSGGEIDAALGKSRALIAQLVEEIAKDIPMAAAQIFDEVGMSERRRSMSEAQWLEVWHTHPELLEMISLEGMARMVQWATVVQQQQHNDDDDEERCFKGDGR